MCLELSLGIKEADQVVFCIIQRSTWKPILLGPHPPCLWIHCWLLFILLILKQACPPQTCQQKRIPLLLNILMPAWKHLLKINLFPNETKCHATTLLLRNIRLPVCVMKDHKAIINQWGSQLLVCPSQQHKLVSFNVTAYTTMPVISKHKWALNSQEFDTPKYCGLYTVFDTHTSALQS